jgi:AraC-like DNA-binding protein
VVEPDELAELIARYATSDGVHPTPHPRLFLVRLSQPTLPQHAVHEPAFCIIAQGRKQVTIGPKAYVYDPSKYFVVSVDVPVTGRVVEATPQRPYLCFRLDLHTPLVGTIILETPPSVDPREAVPGVAMSSLTTEIRDAALRLLATPADFPALAPLAEREILYRLLSGEQGATIRQIALANSNARRVGRAIDWIRRNYREELRIDALAAVAAMSRSALHAHFKTVTAMSPLQYQKQLRLQEARRLMMGEAMDAARAAYEVGYESPSQFSREYRRLFGNPPARDVARLRDVAGPKDFRGLALGA